MRIVDGRGADTCRTRYGIRVDRIAQQLDGLFVGIGIGCADVNDEPALVGDDIVLRSGGDLRYCDLYRAEQLRLLLETE